jgi:hypothetical protein
MDFDSGSGGGILYAAFIRQGCIAIGDLDPHKETTLK